MSKIKIIYILSLAHSGSTLLDLFIGSAKEVFSLGELGYYPEAINGLFGEDHLCSCGSLFKECAFWSNINAKKYKIYNYSKIKDFVDLKKLLIKSFYSKYKIEVNRDETVNFLKHVFRRSKEFNPDTKYLLDSSKSLIRFFYLSQFQEIDLYPILLVRDVRGVLNSWAKWITNKGFFSVSIEWLLFNFVAKKLSPITQNFSILVMTSSVKTQ